MSMAERAVWGFAVAPAPREGGGGAPPLEGGRVPDSAPLEGVVRTADRRVKAEQWTDDDILFDARGVPRVQVLADVFSQTSRLRKAAVFKGRQRDTSFLSGRALDIQTGRASVDVADYWVGKFLQCQLAITPLIGTENL